MNRKEFMELLAELYPASFGKDNAQKWVDIYCTVLSEQIDYDMLYNKMINEYENTMYAPSPAYLLKLNDKYREKKYNAYG